MTAFADLIGDPDLVEGRLLQRQIEDQGLDLTLDDVL